MKKFPTIKNLNNFQTKKYAFSSGIICLYLKNYSISHLHKLFLNNLKLSINFENIDTYLENNLKIILINRRNSFNMIELIRGNYDQDNIDYIKTIFSLMTNEEIFLVKNNNFNFLWKYIWCENIINKKYKHEYEKSKIKFNNIAHVIKEIKISKYNETEWGIPKGRRKLNETNFECANREFCEETGLIKNDYKIVNIKPLVENYNGTDNKNYCNHYYFAEFLNDNHNFIIDSNNKDQFNEIKFIKLLSIKECRSKIRKYQHEKFKVINNIVNTIKFIILVLQKNT